MIDFVDYVGAVHDRLKERGLNWKQQHSAVRRSVRIEKRVFVTVGFRAGTDPVVIADRIYDFWKEHHDG